MVSLNEELDQERKKYTMAEIKLRNAERAKDDAERRNQMLQKEMEQFFSTFSDLTATGNTTATDPRRPDRNNPIWIKWREAEKTGNGLLYDVIITRGLAAGCWGKIGKLQCNG